ncbi:MAG: ABC transporter ATP-binding protein [Alphaproteobacteria bacterium HGW-Alphaproteobacteria-2]|nr:MAG: ABC transporter ATP-binding protein [Alphaproteobacteria bacterium HGW-Alphaproteobacteria-2]
MYDQISSKGATLEARNIDLSFGGVAALVRCSLRLEPGRVTAVIGPNGAGKTTLMDVIGGRLRPDSGEVRLDGADISRMPPHRRARLGLLRTFQIARELEGLTLFENLLLAGQGRAIEHPLAALAGGRRHRRAEAAVAARAHGLLERVGLVGQADLPAGALSGGQKKLLEVARALMVSPRILVLDEPTAGVSPPLARVLADLTRDLAREGLTVAFVEHDMDFVQNVADHVVVLAEGQVLASGSFAEVTGTRDVIDAYLGRAA